MEFLEFNDMNSLPPEGIVLNLVTPAIGYMLLAGLSYIIFYVLLQKKLEKKKIQKSRPGKLTIQREFLLSLRTLIIYFFGGVIVVLLVDLGYTKMYMNVDEMGYAYLFLSIIATVIIHDTHFYWIHRLMHSPRIYKWTHGTHHNYHNPTPWSSFTFAPVEALLQFSIIPLLLFLIPLHWISLVAFLIIMVGFNVLGHLGNELFSPRFKSSWVGRWLNTSTHHNLHHSGVRGNYGLYFIFWDRWMKTEKLTS